MKKSKTKRLTSWLIPKLRQISLYWPPRTIALQKAKVYLADGNYKNGNPRTRVKFRCEVCKELFERNEIQMDHRVPVVDISGFNTWDEYINSLFCSEQNYSALCKPCHDNKTLEENKARKKENS